MSIPPAKHLINYMLFTGSLKKGRITQGTVTETPVSRGQGQSDQGWRVGEGDWRQGCLKLVLKAE